MLQQLFSSSSKKKGSLSRPEKKTWILFCVITWNIYGARELAVGKPMTPWLAFRMFNRTYGAACREPGGS